MGFATAVFVSKDCASAVTKVPGLAPEHATGKLPRRAARDDNRGTHRAGVESFAPPSSPPTSAANQTADLIRFRRKLGAGMSDGERTDGGFRSGERAAQPVILKLFVADAHKRDLR